MNKFKRFGVSILSLGLVLALNPVTTFAAEPETSVVTSESNAIGGWSEEDGYFVNPQAYSKAMQRIVKSFAFFTIFFLRSLL